jgi:hypothetical protein
MQPRDGDIEFDFFDDEPATGENQSVSRVRLPGAPRRYDRRSLGPPTGLAPMLRLLGLVAVVVVLMLVFVLLIQSCAGSSKRDAYAAYMSRVSTIASSSSANGTTVSTVLTTPGLKLADIEAKLGGIAEQERQNVRAAQNLNAPGPLRDGNAHLVEALQFRVSGIEGLALTFKSTATSKDNSADAALLAEQANRLVASDVVWDDLFRAPTLTRMTTDGVTGVRVPESHFISSDLVTARSMALVLQRIRGASTGGTVTGLHGTNLVSVKALPGGQVLAVGSLNTVTATTDLAFAVTVNDSGNFQEVQIPVTLTIEKAGSPIVQTQTIQLINPSEQKVITFTNLGSVPFATQTTVKVDVKPVPGEVNIANNSAQYPVIFSLPGG